MTTTGIHQRAVDFLRAEMDVIDLKIARVQSALDAAEDRLERTGLEAMLYTLSLEREVIHSLIMCQVDDDALSLEAQIMQRIECAESRLQQSPRWRRGQRTPADYWDAQIQRNKLNKLLAYFHAWPYDHPHEEHVAMGPHDATIAGTNISAHPWYTTAEVIEARKNGSRRRRSSGYSRSAEMLFEDVVAALDAAGVAGDHLEIITEPLGNVIVTGYAHSTDEHDRVLNTLLDVDGVFEVIEDIKIVEPDDCPICRANGPAISGAHRRNGRT